MVERVRLLFVFMISVLPFVACNRNEKLFTALSPSKTHVEFVNRLEPRAGLGILYYIYYYNGGGVALGDINNDGLTDIYFTANSRSHNKLFLNKGNFQFEDITEKAGVAGSSDWCTGVTMADVNGDGLLDIYVCAVANMHGLHGKNELFINQGNGKFKESAAKYGLDFSGFSTQAVFFDYDKDGDLDCYLLNQSEHPNQNITDTSFRRKFDPYAGDKLYRNDLINGKRQFTDVSAEAGIYQSSLGYGLGIAVADFNNDGWDDIYIGNDFHENDYYYLNNKNGTFTECGANHFRHYSRYSMGNDAADFNNDGQMDLFTADMLPADEKVLKTYGNGEHLDTYRQKITANGYQDQYSKNCLQRNNGNGNSFSDISLISDVSATDWSWSPLFADFDNDGNKDLFISSGIEKRPLDLDFISFFSDINNRKVFANPARYQDLLDKMPDGYSHPYLFKGDGVMNFKDVSEEWGTAELKGCSNGAAYADLDNDGRVDLVINCLDAPALLLRNTGVQKNYLEVAFDGIEMNRKGIGAKVYLFMREKMQYQQLMLTRGFMSSSEPRLHFGLDSLRTIDSLLVVWPNENYELIKNVPANRQITLHQTDAISRFDKEKFFPQRKSIVEDVTRQLNVQWKHRENNFTEFDQQYLIPHLESTRGPRMAVADVNEDGLDDIFVCGAKGQAGCLLIQTTEGKFIKSDSSIFEKNKNSEGVDAIFFDANNDGHPDLYVVSGGDESEDGNPALADHLYLNDGRGHFKEADNALPQVLINKSCVAVADVNGDGYPDLFIGGLTDAKRYGYSPTPSFLLLNDGKGKFHPADQSDFSFSTPGLVTAATFADLDHDGWPDLVVAGEWMGVKIFMNQHGRFKQVEIPNSSGLWQSILVADVNGDGWPDILAGNWGRNSKLFAGKDGPVKLYVKDFDHNGSVEQVMTYTIGGQEYSFLGKDQLEQALPILKKKHLSYDEVAGRSVSFMFGELFSDYRELRAEVLSSSCFLNDGKGNFTRIDLPEELQLSPVFAFAPFSEGQQQSFMAVGNFYGVLPYEGRYDAICPTIFTYANRKFLMNSILSSISAECRDVKDIRYAGERKGMVISANNHELLFLRQTPGLGRVR